MKAVRLPQILQAGDVQSCKTTPMKTYGVLYEKRENDSGGIVRELHNGSLDY
jgi:hypothetical protein